MMNHFDRGSAGVRGMRSNHKMWGRQVTAGCFQPAVISRAGPVWCLKIGQVRGDRAGMTAG